MKQIREITAMIKLTNQFKQILIAFLLCAISVTAFADMKSSGKITTTYHFTVYQTLIPNQENNYQLSFTDGDQAFISATCNGQTVSPNGGSTIKVAQNAALSCSVTIKRNVFAHAPITYLVANYTVKSPLGHCVETVISRILPDTTISPVLSSNTNYGEATISNQNDESPFSNDTNASVFYTTSGNC